jgi:SAM-dependent methyltransferase
MWLYVRIDRYQCEEFAKMSGSTAETRETVRRRYADAALSVTSASGCCSSEPAAFETSDSGDFGTWLYAADQLATVPDGAALASLGCGNPTAVAELKEGETVLDLGSGAGIDVLLSAKRVGPTGYVYGLDMTDEMLELANKHKSEAGVENVEFRKGLIEESPIDEGTVDVIISNCVINLSTDKPSVFSEMFRVLKPGGRIGVTDVVADDALTESQRLERGSWVGCVAGALSFGEYEKGLARAGFGEVSIESTHDVADGMHSVIVKATKP